jgi:quercetin dioxygenase-like cupin family protein
MDQIYFDHSNVKTAQLAGGIVRKVLAYSDTVMTTYWEVPLEASIPMHAHPHEQMSIVISGKAEYTVGDKVYPMNPGDSIVMPPNVPHCVKVLEPLVAIDVFSPIREDFLK